MDEQFINEVITKYKSFRQNLEEQIKSNQIELQNNECYLINEYWDNEINRIIKNYELGKKNGNNTSSNFALPRQSLKFINNISNFVEYIKKKKKCKLISREFIDFIKEKINLNLSQNTIVQYYTGNYKLIIEFKGGNENNTILIEYPLLLFHKLYFIEIKNDDFQNKKSLYSKILSTKESIDKIKVREFNKIIFSKEEFINNKNIIVYNINNISKNNEKEKINKSYKYLDLKYQWTKNAYKRKKIRSISNENSFNSIKGYSTKKISRNESRDNFNFHKINSGFSKVESKAELLGNQKFYPVTPKANKSFKNDIQMKGRNKEDEKETNNELIKENKILKNNELKYLNEINKYKLQIMENEKEMKNKINLLENQINELKQEKMNNEKILNETKISQN